MIPHIPHKRFDEAKKELYSLVLGAPPTFPEIYQVIAPTKSGKTHLADLLEAEIRKTVAQEDVEPHEVPLVRIELKSPLKGSFDYSAMYRSILAQVHPHATGIKDKDLPEHVTDGLIKRKTRYLIEDEGHHLMNATKASADQDRMRNQLDRLKTTINETKTNLRLVLFGGPALARTAMINSHFATRSHFILLAPYDGRKANDRGEFRRLLIQTLTQARVSGWKQDDNELVMSIMNRCQGQIGWFWECMELTKRRSGNLTIKDVMNGLPSPIGMESIVHEIRQMRALEEKKHPVSDLEFAGLSPRFTPPSSIKTGKVVSIGKRGNKRDPACTVP